MQMMEASAGVDVRKLLETSTHWHLSFKAGATGSLTMEFLSCRISPLCMGFVDGGTFCAFPMDFCFSLPTSQRA